jgi:hypothetical protein
LNFNPTKPSDFFNREQVEKLEESVKRGQSCLLFGDTGVGKTSSAYFVARHLGMPLEEFNASDYRRKGSLENLLKIVSMKGFVKKIYLLDEVDGIDSIASWKIVSRICLESKHPIILTANDSWKVPDDVKNNCVQLKYQKPPLISVVAVIRESATKNGIKPKYENISDDFRASSNAALYGGVKHQTSDIFSDVTKMFRTGEVPSTLDRNIFIWLLDNANRFYSGRKLYEFIQVLSRIDRIRSGGIVNRWSLLSNFYHAETGTVVYPYYLRRRSVLKGKAEST